MLSGGGIWDCLMERYRGSREGRTRDLFACREVGSETDNESLAWVRDEATDCASNCRCVEYRWIGTLSGLTTSLVEEFSVPIEEFH